MNITYFGFIWHGSLLLMFLLVIESNNVVTFRPTGDAVSGRLCKNSLPLVLTEISLEV